MRNKNTYIDLTEFVNNPCKTGIQRVCNEIIKHWPKQDILTPILIDNESNLLVLPFKLLNLINLFFERDDTYKLLLIKQIKDQVKLGCKKILLNEDDYVILNPELFYDISRFRFYLKKIADNSEKKIYFIIYDLLPYIYPEDFPRNAIRDCTPYLSLITQLSNKAFISQQTKEVFYERAIKKNPNIGDPVLFLGSDSLGTHEKVFDGKNTLFSITGTIRPGKNIEKVISVFETLWEKNINCSLKIMGGVNWPNNWMKNKLCTLNNNESQFSWIDSPNDQIIREEIINSLCTIYPSQNEGFGLPPIESLSLGTPVIVGSHIPSVENLSDKGIIKIQGITCESLTTAVYKMLDKEFAETKCIEIKDLSLPKWKDFAVNVYNWVSKS
jgi:glycosyltransferase involved in cell wall biosynthesis